MAAPFIATKPIFVGTALAHNVGDEVPDENVKANGWEDSVSRADSKSAQEAQKEAVKAAEAPTQAPVKP